MNVFFSAPFGPPKLSYLFLLFIIGCDPGQTHTIVTLHHIDAENLRGVLTESLGTEIKYSITENKIIISEKQININQTLRLLESLDQPPLNAILHFKAGKQYKYTTTTTPGPYALQVSGLSLIHISEPTRPY